MQLVPPVVSPDRAVPVNTIENRPVSNFNRVCGTCGAIVASGHVQKHIDWHATGSWAPATVTTAIDPAQK